MSRPLTQPVQPAFVATDAANLASREGRIALIVSPTGKLDATGRRLNAFARKAIERATKSDRFEKLAEGETMELAYPAGLACEAVLIVKLSRRANADVARQAGAAIGKAFGKGDMLVLVGMTSRVADLALGVALRAYDFADHKTGDKPARGALTIMTDTPDDAAATYAPLAAVATGVLFTRDLVNAPANILTTTAFADRLAALSALGLKVQVLEEAELAALGMGSLLCVGQGSASPSKVVVMEWNGGTEGQPPFAFVGKGVVFDTGGISIKPAGGMEEMTMDMGGAGVVGGVMATLALRKARANVVGLVGIVENMPSGTAVRPGDVVTSMKGDTIEVINTDAEGRLVLADVLWYAQTRFNPVGMIDLATLTGAIIVALGHENAGVFSNSDKLAAAVLKAAGAEGEGAWRMPMGKAYDDKLKSRIADMMNVGGRDGGSITAAQFLKRFVKDEVPWCHIDIAGTALLKADSTLAPKGATGWGVMTLNRLIADGFEDA